MTQRRLRISRTWTAAQHQSILLLAMAVMAAGETRIAGDISRMAFDTSGNPFIIESDVVVPAGKSVVIPGGCILLFSAYSALTIEGSLSADGSAEHPVVFSSINDNYYNPAAEKFPGPFDWNGISVAAQSKSVVLKNFRIKYSVFGIKSRNPHIRLEHGIFSQNGQYNLTINDAVQAVPDTMPFSWNVSRASSGFAAARIETAPPGATVALDGATVGTTPVSKDSITPGHKTFRFSLAGYVPLERSYDAKAGDTIAVTITLAKERRSAGRPLVWRIAFGALALGGGAAGYYLDTRMQRKISDNESLGSEYRANPSTASYSAISGAYHANFEAAKSSMIERDICYGFAALCVAGFALTFVF